ncbi:hypothetical protein O181_012289 [Austropuccinia psidii MF-1]|uniref:Tf2-1-like SH3-like domain-containing protein n=1 Tax=Austropuccinia psidii MF-1 TaxID=1389203 RepID=A0A9Q3BUF3_9BASI|nr:hypothetical protein [Austropuccinia psidii MF-1]
MLGTKVAFWTAYHTQTDGLAERMIQKMQDIIRRFCTYVIEYKDHEGYTLWVTLLPSIQLAYNTCKHFTIGKEPSLVEKGWNSLIPVDHLKKNLLTIHPTAKDFHHIWKREFDTAARCIAEAKEYNKQRYDNNHKEPGFREGDQVLLSTLNLSNLKGQRKMRDSLLGPFTIIRLIGKNSLEVRLKEEFSRKHPAFPVSLVKSYHQTGEDMFPSRIKSHTPQEIVEVEDSPVPVR